MDAVESGRESERGKTEVGQRNRMGEHENMTERGGYWTLRMDIRQELVSRRELGRTVGKTLDSEDGFGH